MPARSRVIKALRPLLDRHQAVKAVLKYSDLQAARLYHSVGRRLPYIIRPEPRHLTIAITAHCNLRCLGCGYGRDFMAGQQLSFEIVREILDDARDAGVNTVRLYGGEPLLHRDLPRMIKYSVERGFYTYVTTNGTLLRHKIDDLYEAGLRLLTIGFYGIGERHSVYTQRGNSFRRLDESLAVVRERYGNEVELQLNFVVMAASCSAEAARDAWEFAQRHNMYFHIDLVNSTVPFFQPGADGDVEIISEHRPQLIALTEQLLRLKRQNPSRFLHSVEFLRSIPDWLLNPAEMHVPCDAYQTIWVGADGTVQLCDTALRIGNVREHRLRDILFTDVHKKAARDGFCLNCPQCLCKIETRI